MQFADCFLGGEGNRHADTLGYCIADSYLTDFQSFKGPSILWSKIVCQYVGAILYPSYLSGISKDIFSSEEHSELFPVIMVMVGDDNSMTSLNVVTQL